MQRRLIKYRLILFIISQNIISLLRGFIDFKKFRYSLKKQMILSSLFRFSKYSKVGDKTFVDPFVPYFPSSYFKKVLENNCKDSYPLKPNYAQISITNQCPCNCFHCHVKNTQGEDLNKEKILEVIPQIAKMDFPLIFFVGGEPFSRFDDLVEFVQTAQKHMDTRIFTCGIGATTEKLKILKNAGLEGICVSLDHYEENIHNQKRNNKDAFRSACTAIKESSKLGFYVSVVCCTTSSMVKSKEVFKVVDLAESLGAHSIQINEIRPVGRALDAGASDYFLDDNDKKTIIDYYKSQNGSDRKIAVVMPWYNEESYNFGCTATAGQKVYIDANGNMQPCELLKASLGNITENSFEEIWMHFLSKCRHPVRECIISRFNEHIEHAAILPLDKDKTFSIWPEMLKIDSTDIFKKIEVRDRQDQ